MNPSGMRNFCLDFITLKSFKRNIFHLLYILLLHCKIVISTLLTIRISVVFLLIAAMGFVLNDPFYQGKFRTGFDTTFRSVRYIFFFLFLHIQGVCQDVDDSCYNTNTTGRSTLWAIEPSGIEPGTTTMKTEMSTALSHGVPPYCLFYFH